MLETSNGRQPVRADEDQHPSIGHQYLRELRIERELQQADVARKLGVSAAYMNLIEKGKRSVPAPASVEGPWSSSRSSSSRSLARRWARRASKTRWPSSSTSRSLRSLAITEEDIRTLSAEPKAATTITALFNLYKNARTQLDQLLVALHRAERDEAEKHALAKELSTPEIAAEEGTGSIAGAPRR